MDGKGKLESVLPKGIEDMGTRAYLVLETAEVKNFFVVGAIGCSEWKEPRPTYDIDIVIVTETGKIDKLLIVLQERGFRPAKPEARKRLSRGLPVKFRDEKTGRSVDFRIASYTIDREASKRAKEVEIFGKKWRVAPPEELILYKLGRRNLTKFDKEDIKGIIETQGDKLDWNRMERLAETLSKEYSPDFKERFKKIKHLRNEK